MRRVLSELGEVVWVGDDGVRLERPKHIEYAWLGVDELDRMMEHRRPDQILVREIVGRGIAAATRARY